ncbi:MAG: hypothetical protein ABI885_25980 [Gammaproteobacteria bacterium]
MKLAVELVGWVGAALILFAYGMLSAGKLTGRSAIYQGLNIVGAAGFVINSGLNGAYPSAALNIIWIGIGVYALIKYRGARA